MKTTSQMRALARYCFGLIIWLVLGLSLVACTNASAAYSEAAQLQAKETGTVPVTKTIGEPVRSTPSKTPTASALPRISPISTATSRPSRTPSSTSSPTTTPIPSDTPLPTATHTSTPEPTPSGTAIAHTVPILMYHYLSEPPPGADAIRRDLSVSPANFEAQLAYLRQAGYETISLADLAYALSQDAPLPEKPIILTFDDGHRDNYENAFPLLRKYGYTATFFVFTQVIDTYNVDFLTWEMVTEMHQAGMEFGSHSYRHLDMSNRDVDFLVYEILGSKEAIEERIGEPVRFFAYPSGAYDGLTIKVLESANFWGAVTTQWGSTHTHPNRFELPRLRMRGNDRVQDLANKLP